MQVKVVTLVIFLLSLALFPRLLTAVGFPKIIVFLHFIIVPMLFLHALPYSLQNKKLRYLALSLALLFLSAFISMLINNAGLINLLLNFLMIASPLMLVVVICSFVWSASSILLFEKFIVLFIFIHTILAFFQSFILGYRHDDVEGVFIGMGAGGHLAGAISAISALWILKINWIPTKVRYFISILSISVIFLSDSKQVIAVLGVSLFIYFLIVGENFYNKLRLVVLLFFSTGILTVLANTVVPGLLVYLDFYKVFEGVEQKLMVLPVVVSFYDDWSSWLFGLGPGHSVSRLATMLPSYGFLSSGAGATVHDATGVVLMVKESHWLSNSISGSSMFSLDFSLAGIWGDLGIVGFVIFIFSYLILWRFVSETDKSAKFFIISVFVYGFVFTWMEEPSFMLYLLGYIGWSWQKSQRDLKNENPHYP